MSKSTCAFIVATAAVATFCPPPLSAAILGPHAAKCAGRGPAMLVRVEGLKARTGLLRVQSYGGDPARYFDKGTYLERVEVRPPSSGTVEICMPVPRAGTYALSVRHDVAGDGRSSLADGGGMSGNPNISLMDVLLKRKPAASEVEVDVRGVKTVPVRMNYVHGMKVGPITDDQTLGNVDG